MIVSEQKLAELKRLFSDARAEGWLMDGVKMKKWLQATSSLEHTTERYEGVLSDSYRCTEDCPACRLIDSIVKGRTPGRMSEEQDEQTALVECEVGCLTGGLVACPLSKAEQEACPRRQRWKEIFHVLEVNLPSEYVQKEVVSKVTSEIIQVMPEYRSRTANTLRTLVKEQGKWWKPKGKKVTEYPLHPTHEQIGKFWEWFGWSSNGCYWFSPIVCEPPTKKLPPPDMNNLSKYAIAGLKASNKWNITLRSPVLFPNHYLVRISSSLNPHHGDYCGKSEDLALAVFWAIWEMIEKGE